jgi:hypothetical protein
LAASCCFPDSSRFAHRLTALQCLRFPPRSGTRLARSNLLIRSDLQTYPPPGRSVVDLLECWPLVGINLNDSGGRRGWLLIVLCRFSAVLSGCLVSRRVAALPDVPGAAPAPTAPGWPPFRVAGTGMAGQAGAGRAHSRCQQVRNASFQGQVRLIFSTRARAWRTSRAGRLSSR